MAAHSRILAWEIPWTEEAGGLQSTGSQRVRLEVATKQQDRANDNNKVVLLGMPSGLWWASRSPGGVKGIHHFISSHRSLPINTHFKHFIRFWTVSPYS